MRKLQRKFLILVILILYSLPLNAQISQQIGFGISINRIPVDSVIDGSFRYWRQTTYYSKYFMDLQISYKRKFIGSNLGLLSTFHFQPINCLIIEDGFDQLPPSPGVLQALEIRKIKLKENFFNFSFGVNYKGTKKIAGIFGLGVKINNSIRSTKTQTTTIDWYHYDSSFSRIYDSTSVYFQKTKKLYTLTHIGLFAQFGIVFRSKKQIENTIAFQAMRNQILYEPFEYKLPDLGWIYSINYTIYFPVNSYKKKKKTE